MELHTMDRELAANEGVIPAGYHRRQLVTINGKRAVLYSCLACGALVEFCGTHNTWHKEAGH